MEHSDQNTIRSGFPEDSFCVLPAFVFGPIFMTLKQIITVSTQIIGVIGSEKCDDPKKAWFRHFSPFSGLSAPGHGVCGLLSRTM